MQLHRHWAAPILATLMALAGVLFIGPATAYAATIIVNSTADTVAVDGVCTLREAITAANSDAASNECPAGSDADTITFSVNGTITLGSALPNITSELTIDGGGVITVSGDNASRVFSISSSGVATLTGLTIRDGFNVSTGGGVFNAGGRLLLQSSMVFSNTANGGGGLYNQSGGRTTISATAVISNTAGVNGGGVFNTGSGSAVTITNGSQIQGNSAGGRGGGVYSSAGGPVLVAASTIAANSVMTDGGGIFITNSSVVTLTDGTRVEGNSAGASGGGIYTLSGGRASIDGSSVLSNSAVTDGGGIYSGGSGGIALTNGSVVQANVAGGRGGGIFVTDTNLATIDASQILSNSAVTDGGGLANTNQARLAVSGSKIALNTSGAAGGGIANRDSGVLTVTNSSILTNSAGTGGGGLHNAGIGTVVSITASTIHFNSAISTTVGGGGGVFHGSGVMAVADSTVSSNTTGLDGGGFRNLLLGRLTLDRTTVRENVGYAGGIRNSGGRLTLNNSQILSNTGTGGSSYGGGLDSSSDSHNTIYASLFAGNTSSGTGAIYAEGAYTITNSAFRDNNGDTGTGGIRAVSGAMTINNSTISGNSGNSGTQAGGLYANTTVILRNTIIANSVAGPDCARSNNDTINAQHTLIEGGLTCVNGTNTNNLTGDPALNADLTLSSASKAINAGENALIPSGVTTDLAGNARIQQSIVDMGAYESPYAAPTAATVGDFAAALQPDRVRLHWTTLNEVGLTGFHLYRGLDAAGPGERITGAPLPAQGPGELAGFDYGYDDFTPLPADAAVYYWLEEVHSSGERFRHGPQQVGGANAPRIFLPLVER